MRPRSREIDGGRSLGKQDARLAPFDDRHQHSASLIGRTAAMAVISAGSKLLDPMSVTGPLRKTTRTLGFKIEG